MGKGRPRQFDTEHALGVALDLFWTHGYEGTSIALLADKMGIKIPSLYAAFGNKEQLFMLALKQYSQLNGNVYRDALGKATIREVVQGVLAGVVQMMTSSSAPHGCLMVHGALATSPESESIRQILAQLRMKPEQWLIKRFKQGSEEGDLPPDITPETLASYVMTLTTGLAVQAKSGVTQEQLLKIVSQIMLIWPTP